MHTLLLAIAVLTGCSRPARLDPSVAASNAAVRASLGDVTAAAARLEPLLADNAPHWSVLFVAACVAVERGDLGRAGDLAARLHAADAGHAAVLERLVARRRARPTERMTEALTAAWKDAGKPDLSTHQLAKPSETPLPAFDRDALARLGPGVALVFDPSRDIGVMHERALAAARDAGSNPLYVDLAIFRWLTPDSKQSRDDAARDTVAAREVASAAARADPGNGYMSLLVALAGHGHDEPLSASDLDALETVLRKPILFPRERLYAELVRTAAVLDPDHTDVRAMFALIAISPSAPLVLKGRAAATKDEALRERTVRVLAQVGKAFAASGALLDHIVGLALLREAARMSGDATALAVAERARKDGNAWHNAVEDARKRLGFWPLPSLLRERMPFSRERADLDLLVDRG